MNPGASIDVYEETLAEYLKTRSEEALYRASFLSQTFVENGMGPEDIIAFHLEALEKVISKMSFREQARSLGDAHQFLLEIMISYGIKYKEYIELRLRETLREAEARTLMERDRALEAERADRDKSEILGVIAHELRTPITAAIGNIELASRTLPHGDVNRISTFLGSAREALTRLSRLSGDLVEASRGDVPKLLLTPIELGRVVEQACAWAQPAAGAKQIRLERSQVPESILVLGNVDALLSLFGNLLSNAVRYTPVGGHVSVTHGVEDEWAWVLITDTGIGMTDDVMARIFDKFYRAPEARRIEGQGLGLGLSLVQQMVRAHNGRLDVTSEPDKGSAFRAYLPLHRS